MLSTPEHHAASAQAPLAPIGIGTYLGECSEADDERYVGILNDAIRLGVKLIDTSINYRGQRSEQVVGRVLAEGGAKVTVCTKGGYVPLPSDPPKTKAEYRDYLDRSYFQTGLVSPADLVALGHCIAPTFLRNQIDQSRANLGVATIDMYYLHNPEQQLDAISRSDFESRIRSAFELLESAVADGSIASYGCATWNGLRAAPDASNYLSLESLVSIAREVAGNGHHFTTVQLPINLAMAEAVRFPNQSVNGTPLTLLDAAGQLGVSVVASTPLMQGKLAQDLPPQIREALPSAETDAQRALAFVRQLPNVSCVLLGTRNTAHLEEALQAVAVA